MDKGVLFGNRFSPDGGVTLGGAGKPASLRSGQWESLNSHILDGVCPQISDRGIHDMLTNVEVNLEKKGTGCGKYGHAQFDTAELWAILGDSSDTFMCNKFATTKIQALEPEGRGTHGMVCHLCNVHQVEHNEVWTA